MQEVAVPRDTNAESLLSSALRFACRRLPPEDIPNLALPGITAVHLCRAITGLNLRHLLGMLVSLTELDLSGNEMGPQAFRVVVLGIRRNTTLKSLNLANNGGDTDSSVRYSNIFIFKATLYSKTSFLRLLVIFLMISPSLF